MGRDMVCVFQRKEGEHWVDIPDTFDGGRDYDLDCWLGFGGMDYQGIYTISPIATSRGPPSDFELYETDRFVDGTNPHDMLRSAAMRDLSWFFGSEILAAPLPTVFKRVRIPLADYEKWDGEFPSPWEWACSDGGRQFEMVEKIETDEEYAYAEWHHNFATDFKYFTDEVQRLQDAYGETRFVFGYC